MMIESLIAGNSEAVPTNNDNFAQRKAQEASDLLKNAEVLAQNSAGHLVDANDLINDLLDTM